MSTTIKYQTPMLSENIAVVFFQSFLSQVIAWIVVYFTPVKEMVHVMLIFLAVDTITGIWASLKEGNKFSSGRLWSTIMKFICYTIAVLIAFMMEKTFLPDWTRITTIIAGFICFVEFTSILENMTRITEEPIFRRILKLLKRKSSDTIGDIMDDQDEDKKKENE